MVNCMLDSVRDIPTDELERTVVDNHRLGPGYYFILGADGKLDGPYVVNTKESVMKHDKEEWFRVRDFFTQWLNNDANRALSGKAKNWLSAVPMMLAFKKPKVDSVLESRDIIVDAVGEIDEVCRGMPECCHLADSEPGLAADMVDMLCGSISSVLESLGRDGKLNVKDDDRIKIFLDLPEDEYIRHGRKYLYRSMFNKGTFSVVGDRTIGASTFLMSLNAKKPYIIPSDMNYKAPFYLSVEELYRANLLSMILRARMEHGIVYLPYECRSLFDINTDEDTLGYRISFENGEISDFTMNEGREHRNDFYIADYVGLRSLPALKISAAVKKYILGMNSGPNPEDGDGYYMTSDSDDDLFSFYSEGLDEYIMTGDMPFPTRNFLWQQVLRLQGRKSLRLAVNTWLNIKYNGGKAVMHDIFAVSNDDDFFYAAGQLAYFLTSLSESGRTKKNETGLWMQVNNILVMRERIRMMLYEYRQKCPGAEDFRSLEAVVFGYKPSSYMVDTFAEGYFSNNQIWERLKTKAWKDEEGNEEIEEYEEDWEDDDEE